MKHNFNRKILALILSAAMLLNSGAVAFAVEDGTAGEPTVTTSETVTATEEPSSTDTTTTDETTKPAGDVEHAGGEQGDLSGTNVPDSTLPGEGAKELVCTCDPAPGASGVEGHKGGCPLYVPECTCPPVDSGEVVHKEGCLLYEKPAVPEQKCVCTALCAEGSANADCAVCAQDWAKCAYTANLPTEATEAVYALIDALPTIDELAAVDTEGADFPAYLEKLRADVSAARAAFNKLTDEEKASFDPAVLEKLTALEDALLAMFPVLMAGDVITIKVNGGEAVDGESLQAAVTTALNGADISTIKTLTITASEVTAADWTWFAGSGTPVLTALTDFTVEGTVTAVAPIPDAVKNKRVFPQSIASVTIPQVTSIGNYAFNGCLMLKTADLPAVVTIGSDAFQGCRQLATASFSNVTSIGANAFFTCEALANVSFPSATSIGASAFHSCEALTDISFPVAESIGDNAFNNCTKLATASFPMVETIGNYAFTSCGALATLKLPEAPPAVSNANAFNLGLSSRDVKPVDASGNLLSGLDQISAEYAYDGANDGMENSTAIDGLWYGWKVRDAITESAEAVWAPTGGSPAQGTLADALAAMGTSGGSIKLLAPVSTADATTLPAYPIALDLNGKTWTAGGAVKVISGCTLTITDTTGGKITAATTSAVLVSSGGTLDVQGGSFATTSTSMLAGISNYGTLKLSGGSVSSANSSAIFNMGTGTLYLSGAPTFSSSTSKNINGSTVGGKIYANDGTGSPAYLTSAVSIQIPVNSSADYVAVNGVKDVEQFNLFSFSTPPADLAFVYDDAANTIKLAAPEKAITIKINDSTTEVGGADLKTAIGSTTLSSITKLEITKGEVTAADWTWFTDDGTPVLSALTDFTVDAAVTSVAPIPDIRSGSAFPTTIVNVTIPQVLVIGLNAFYNCQLLESVSFPATTTIGDAAFQKCYALTSVSFPVVKTIGANAFTSCNKLTTATFPAVTAIGDEAFNGCSSFKTLQLGATVPTIVSAVRTFKDCHKYDNKLTPVGADGTLLTESTNPKLSVVAEEYDKVASGDTGTDTDGVWCGWKVREPVAEPEAEWTVNNGEPQRGTFADAVSAVSEKTGTIKLLKDVSTNTTVTINSTVTLDLGGKTLSTDSSTIDLITVKAQYKGFYPGGKLTLKDSGTGGTLTMTSSSTLNSTILIEDNTELNEVEGTVTIESGTVSGGSPTITNKGELTITGGTVSGRGHTVYNFDTVTMTGGRLTTTGATAFDNSTKGVFALIGGTIEGGSASAILNRSKPDDGQVGVFLGGSPVLTVKNAEKPHIEGGGKITARVGADNYYSGGTLRILYTDRGYLKDRTLVSLVQDEIKFNVTIEHQGYEAIYVNGGSGKNNYIKAVCKIFPITYKDGGGGEYSGSNLDKLPTTHTFDPYGSDTRLIDGMKNDYDFGGWFKESNCSGTGVTKLPCGDYYPGGITLYAKWTKKVVVIPVDGVTVDPTSKTLAAGETVQLTEAVTPANATNKSVSWSSSDTTIATVTSGGLVSAVKAGTATITVTTTSGSKKATCAITVTPGVPPTGNITIKLNGGDTEYSGTDLPATVTKALDGAALSSITKLIITAGEVTAADWATVTKCTALTDFTVDAAVTKVADIPDGNENVSVFPGTIQTVSIPRVSKIGTYAFKDCAALKTATLPALETISNSAFQNCEMLESASFPEVKSIGIYAFAYCTNLKSASFPEATSIGKCAFQTCEVLVSVNFPVVESIGNNSFTYCIKLTSASFPKVTGIGNLAFASCEVLATLKLPAEAPIVTDANAFYKCPLDRSLKLVDADGKDLTGTDLTTAQGNYKAAADGDKTDDLWYGWKIGGGTAIAVTGVSLNKSALSLEADKSETLIATIAPANATNTAVTWKSSDPAVATVTDGLVSALKAGTAAITVTTTDGTKTATCAVTVTAKTTGTAPGGKLEAPLTQDKLDEVFGKDNATLDESTNPDTIKINNDITVETPIIVPAPITIDLGGKEITGGAGANPVIKIDGGTGTITGGGSITGGDGGAGVEVGGGGEVIIGGGTEINGGGSSTGNGGSGITGDGSVVIGGGGSGSGGGSASGGNGGGSSGNGGSGVDVGGDIEIGSGGSATGGDGSGTGSGGDGANSGTGDITIDGGKTEGGNGGTNGGSGGDGVDTSGGSGGIIINGGGSSTGGSGGNNSSGTGGDGGNGATSGGGSITVDDGASSEGGKGGNGSTAGGSGGNGTATGGTDTTIDGGATGGNGGNGTGNGNGGNGGDGAHQGGGTVDGSGSATGGNGGSGAGTGTGGSGGKGVGGGAGAGSGLNVKNGISTKIEVTGDAGVKVELPNTKETVDAVLTDEEKADNTITDVKVTLKVDDKTADKPNKDAVEGAKPANSIVGAFFNITLQKTVTNAGGETTTNVTETQSGKQITITIEIPANMQGGSDYVVIRVHTSGGATTATLLNDTDNDPNTITFLTDKFSTYAIAYTKSVTPPTPPTDNTGSGGGSSDNGEYDFWMSVKDKINNADSGDVIKVSARANDKMPESVMDALRKNPGVTLVISWNGGKTITIPAGKAQKREAGRIYYPLSLLAELYQGIEYVETPADIGKLNPETGGTGYIAYADGKQIPMTGGVAQLDAPAIDAPNAITPEAPAAITPPTAGFEPDAFAGTPDAARANSGNPFTVIALMLAAAAVGGGVWFWKKRREEEQSNET